MKKCLLLMLLVIGFGPLFSASAVAAPPLEKDMFLFGGRYIASSTANTDTRAELSLQYNISGRFALEASDSPFRRDSMSVSHVKTYPTLTAKVYPVAIPIYAGIGFSYEQEGASQGLSSFKYTRDGAVLVKQVGMDVPIGDAFLVNLDFKMTGYNKTSVGLIYRCL